MMSRPNYLPGMAYLLVTSFFPEWNYFSAPLLINTLLIFVLGWLFKMYNHPKAKGIVFNTGLGDRYFQLYFFPVHYFYYMGFVCPDDNETFSY